MAEDLKINVEEEFETLENAPAKEVVLELRARAEEAVNLGEFKAKLEAALPDYPTPKVAQDLKAEIRIPEKLADEAKGAVEAIAEGFRFESEDKLQIGHFLRDRFAFNRLEPYEDWDRFSSEALRLWGVQARICRPSEIQRIGLRFINQVEVDGRIKLEDYFTTAPPDLQNLPIPLTDFLYRDTYDVTGHPYNVRVVKTAIPGNLETGQLPRMVLDIDTFTTEPIDNEEDKILKALAEMRWLKNKAFFGTFTEQAVDLFR